MSSAHPFKQVDVFTSAPLRGNPVAVVFGADGLSDAQMLRLASWTNLSETTFICRPSSPGAAYLLRIFQPRGELPFAGHPAVGSAHAALEAGVVAGDAFVMDCSAGRMALQVEGDGADRIILVETPRAEFVHEFGTSLEAISSALGTTVTAEPPPASVYNGPTWLFCQLPDSATLAGLTPDLSAVARLSRDLGLTGFACFALTGSRPAVHLRVFAPAVAVNEDPVTGSANASLPTYLARYGLLDRIGGEYTSTQGRELGRDGTVYVRTDGVRTTIGGQAVTVINGEVRL